MTEPADASAGRAARLAELDAVDDQLAAVRATWPRDQAQAAVAYDRLRSLVRERDRLEGALRATDLAPEPGPGDEPRTAARDAGDAELGVLLPLRIETRFKDGALHLRVIPDEPWFTRHDPRISDGELTALRRFVRSANKAEGPAEIQVAWRELAVQTGAARAVFLHRRLVTVGPDGVRTVRAPTPDERRTEPILPRIVGFPEQLTVWLEPRGGIPRPVLTLQVDRSRLLADFGDAGEARWWEDWDEAVAIGMAGVVPAAELTDPVGVLYVTGLGEEGPAGLFTSLVSEGRLGVLSPGLPTNSVQGGPAAPLADDPDTWWKVLTSPPGTLDADISRALTGDPLLLGAMPGGDGDHRARASALVTAVWPALWGFAAAHVWNVAHGSAPALWARHALFPEGPYPSVRVASQPYGLLPTTAWGRWQAAVGDPSLEGPLVRALLKLRGGHAARARARGTAAGQSTQGLIDLIGQTPTSPAFRYRAAWPLELWWLGAIGSQVPIRWRDFAAAWDEKYSLAATLRLDHVRRYGTRGQARLLGIPLVVPAGGGKQHVGGALRRLAQAAIENPSSFGRTLILDRDVLDRRGNSLLLRLVVRSLQVLIADVARERAGVQGFDPEPFSRPRRFRGRLEELVATVGPIDTDDPTPAVARLLDATRAITTLAGVPVADLERMVAAAVDTSSHRIDPWLVGVAQRRFDALQDGGARRRLGAYGWVDEPGPGAPGPSPAGLLAAPSPGAALAAAVLRDRAVNDADDPRWDLDVTSRRARTANRIAEHVRIGAHLSEALGREIERIVGRGVHVERLRTDFPVRTENAGRRVCDGLKVLAQDPFPVPLDQAQTSAVADLRQAIDTYADLLVAEAVFHLSEGRSEVAGAVMDAAAGLSRPPELALLRTAREGRAVSTSVVIALRRVARPPLPPDQGPRALVGPVRLLDASVAAFLEDRTGTSADWQLDVARLDADGRASGNPVTVTVADLGLRPAEALSLTLTDLERLAAEHGLEQLDLDPRTDRTGVVGGSARERYELAARLVGLLGRAPGGPPAVAEGSLGEDDPATLLDLADRFLDVRRAGEALVAQLDGQVARLGPDGGVGTADRALLRQLVRRCRAWGLAPDPPATVLAGATNAADARLRRVVAVAVRALPRLEQRLAAAPSGDAAVRALSRDELVSATVALASPTGQLALTGDLRADALPDMTRAARLDAEWLTVVAAVRPALARLEVHQLAGARLAGWSNRPADPWQQDTGDARRFVVVYAPPGLDLGSLAGAASVAVASLDRFTEVVPAATQAAGAAFGFDAPAARPQQAILLAVPPVATQPLDDETLVDVLVETRELAHARMARPADLAGEFWGIGPTALLPATGGAAIPLEVVE